MCKKWEEKIWSERKVSDQDAKKKFQEGFIVLNLKFRFRTRFPELNFSLKEKIDETKGSDGEQKIDYP